MNDLYRLTERRCFWLVLAGSAALLAGAGVPAHAVEAQGRPPVVHAVADTPSGNPSIELHPPHKHSRLVGNPNVRSASVLVIDEADSSILYAKQADRVMPVASITKLMTALVVLEAQQSLDELIMITSQDRDTLHGSGSRLAVGTILTRGELMHLALMSSENRAAHALGRTYPGGLSRFLRAMNAKAQALGMKSARFVDPTGLSNQNVATAMDLSKLVLAAALDPMIRKFSTYDHYAVPVGRHLLEYRNTNLLVSKPDWIITVQKTGYTQEAGQCLVMHTIIQDRPVVMVLLNSFGKYTRVADARRIRQWMESAPLAQAARDAIAQGSGRAAQRGASFKVTGL